jgi:hypothetical protein
MGMALTEMPHKAGRAAAPEHYLSLEHTEAAMTALVGGCL